LFKLKITQQETLNLKVFAVTRKQKE